MPTSNGSIRTVLVAFGVGMFGAFLGLTLSRAWSNDGPLPIVMSDEAESQFPSDSKSFLEIGSRFPDEAYYSSADASARPFHELVKSSPTVMLLWSPACESCIKQDSLWNRVMRPALLTDVQEVLCLPLHYKDSTSLSRAFTRGRKVVFFDDEQFRTEYRLTVMPTIISLDNQGFINAIQYGYWGTFTKDLIEAVTEFQVGPTVRVLRQKAKT